MSTRFTQYKMEIGTEGLIWKQTDDAMKDEMNVLDDELALKEDEGAAGAVATAYQTGVLPFSGVADPGTVENNSFFMDDAFNLKFKDNTGTVKTVTLA